MDTPNKLVQKRIVSEARTELLAAAVEVATAAVYPSNDKKERAALKKATNKRLDSAVKGYYAALLKAEGKRVPKALQ